MKISHVHEKQLLFIGYLAETLINEIHSLSNLLLKIYLIMISIIFWFTKNFIIKLNLGLFLRYSYNLCNFHPDIPIEAILIKNACIYITTIFYYFYSGMII